MAKPLYDEDFVRWTEEQAAALRQGRIELLDRENLAEEIESLGRSDRRKLKSRLEVLLRHLLKRDHQPELMGKSWAATIREQRRRIKELLEESSSLKPAVPDAMRKAYEEARDRAADEAGLIVDDLPEDLPYTEAEVLGEED
jgi:Domain of unknown function DUF29